jgi:hypothetical protein
MAVPSKYQAKEVLNKVLNAGEDALKVDIDNVTLDGSQLSVDIDNANDSIVIFSNTVADGSGTNTVPLVDAAGNLQIDIVSSALPSGGATAANQSTIIGHVDGLETLITSTNSKIDTLDAVQDNALTKLGEIETTNNANQVLLGTIDSDTDAIKTAVQILDNAIDGSQMQVDVVAALPVGSNTIGVVDLGSTDNAVLDAMVVDLAEIEVATEATQSALEKMLYGNALVITAIHGSGSTQDLSGTYEALYVGVGGDVVVTMVGTGNFTFKNVASGQLLPIRITHVVNTNTTATNMIALKA